MRIRKLELQGFKSFADRAGFHFGPGISGVVGPNGCGKSNVVDAVRWCIGEQSAKSLRGDQMTDVIFAGSAARQPVGFAEVSLTFVATDEPFPGIWARFEELEVTRRLYRNGGSEYLVNQEKVRLKDIADLFLDTGVGNRLYSFIEQGRIGQIVHARPEQRRTLIEEAAGISRYKLRREESMEKLASTRTSLERVSDLSEEMAKQLRGAERAVQRALKARALGAKVRQEELAVSLARFSGLAADRKVLGERFRTADAELGEATRAVLRHEEDLTLRRGGLEALEAEAGRARDRLADVESQRRVEESAGQYLDREAQTARGRLAQLATDHVDQQRERDVADSEADLRAGDAAVAEAGLAEARRALDGASETLRRAHEQNTAARASLETAKREATSALETAVRARGALAGVAARRAELAARAERHRTLAADVVPARADEEVALRHAAVAAAESEVANARADVAAAVAVVAAGEEHRRAREGELKTAELTLTAQTRDAERIRTRLDALVEMDRRDADVPDGVRAALTVPGVIGMLAREISATEDVEALLARALDGGLDTVLVSDPGTAAGVAAAAAGTRVRILVVGAPQGVSGLATEVTASAAGKSALSMLLPHCLVADTVAEAYAVWRPGVAVVTRDGAVLRADGVLQIGGDPGAGVATLKRRREIAAVERRLADVPLAAGTAAVEAAKSNVLEAEAAAALARGAIDAARVQERAKEAVFAEARHRLREAEGERTRALKAADALAKEAEAIHFMGMAIDADESRASEAIRVADGRHAIAEAAVRAAQVALETIEPALAAAGDVVQKLRLDAQGFQKDALANQAAAAGARARAERAAQRSAAITQERGDVERRISEIGVESEAARTKLQALGEEQGVVHAALEALKERVREERERTRAAEAAARAARDRRDAAKDRHVEAEAALADVRAQIERVREEADARHGLSLPGLLDRLDRDGQILVDGYFPDDGERELGAEIVPTMRLTVRDLEMDTATRLGELNALRDALAKTGEINPTAIDEYRDVATRHADIDRQRQDLSDAMDIIERAIAKINKTCRERFRETFDLVNEHFQTVYPRLVGGGFARLELTDEEDLLTCGVEVVVQPPGKRVQNLTLLSGGEKAMAAIALIFSLFRVKPSPFCLLDEVDAPLDEGNGARFNEMLREMSTMSQFIVITHNKKTMECADVLYGVTMPEPGTSRLVSVRLD